MVGVPVQAVMGHRAVPGHGVSRNRPVSRSSYNFKQLLQTHFSLDIALNSRFSREGCHKRGAFRHDAPFKDQMRRVNRLLQPLNASHRANSPQVVKLGDWPWLHATHNGCTTGSTASPRSTTIAWSVRWSGAWSGHGIGRTEMVGVRDKSPTIRRSFSSSGTVELLRTVIRSTPMTAPTTTD